MRSLDKEQKVVILLAALEERYNSLRTIRDRVQNIGIWALGIFMTAGSWIILNENKLSQIESGLYILGVAVAFFTLHFKYLEDLHRGFNAQLRVTVRLEKALGFFTEGYFDDEDTPLYPKKWESAGSEKGDGNFFNSTYILLYIGFEFFIISVVLSVLAPLTSK
jgi:hypothetical protein